MRELLIDSDIERFAAAILLEKGLAANTCEAYGRDLRFFARYLKKRGIATSEAVSRDVIVDYLRAERTDGMSSATRARRTAAIRTFFAFLKARHLLKHNPAELLEPPKKARPLPKTLSEEEVARLIDAVEGTEPRDVRDRAMLEVLYGCGLRVSELCEMTWEQIVADGELIRVTGKGSKDRLVPLGGAAGRALAAYRDGARAAFLRDPSEPHVFLTRLGRPFTRRGVFKMLVERATNVGIAASRISPHVMRHCFASHMLAHGADIRAIQELLGHADIATTQIYTHVDNVHFSDIHRRCHPRG